MISISKPSKKVMMIGLLAGLLIVPTAVNAYSNDVDPAVSTTPVTETTEQAEEPTVPAAETAVATDTPTIETETVVETPEIETPAPENPETPIVDDGVTLGDAQIIAQTEHPGVALKSVKLSVYEGNSVYVFKFDDGWKIYVNALDGTVVLSVDKQSRGHDCKNKLKNDPQFQAWLQSKKDNRKNSNSNSKYGSHRSNQERRSNSGQDWSRKHSRR